MDEPPDAREATPDAGRRDSNAEARDSQPRSGGFDPSDLAAALHDASNELTAVLGWADRARNAEGLDAMRAALELVARRALVAREILRSAVGAKRGDGWVPDRAPLTQVIRDAVAGVDPEAQRRAVAVVVDVDARASRASVEQPGDLLRVLTNLLTNAVAFSPRGGRVDTVARLAGQRICVRVTDEGPGIAPERRPTLFEAPGSTRPGGAGQGLRSAHRLSARAGGELVADECATGASFTLTWPAVEQAVAELEERVAFFSPPRASDAELRHRDAPRRSVPPLAGTRVLVLEDDVTLVELIATSLELRGALVTVVKSAAELIELLDGPEGFAGYDVVLCDLSPIKGQAATTLHTVVRRMPRARLVIMSGGDGHGIELAAESRARWLRKPFEVAELVSVLSEVT